MSFKTTATIANFGGHLLKLTHQSSVLGCEMALNLYLPPQAGATSHKVPVLLYLAGLTCTGDNGAEKGFFQYGASQKGIAVVYPDTSPSVFPTPYIPRQHRIHFYDFKVRTFVLIHIYMQEILKSKGKTTPTTSAQAPVSISTPPMTPGPKTTKWNPT
jgi:hypothetical protein